MPISTESRTETFRIACHTGYERAIPRRDDPRTGGPMATAQTNENASLIDVIRLMYGYNTWANERIMAQVAELTPEQYVASGNASFSSVRDTLVHTMSAQAIWLSRWQGRGN